MVDPVPREDLGIWEARLCLVALYDCFHDVDLVGSPQRVFLVTVVVSPYNDVAAPTMAPESILTMGAAAVPAAT